MAYITGADRYQAALLPATIDDYIEADSPVRVIDAFVGNLNVADLGIVRHPRRQAGQDMIRLTF